MHKPQSPKPANLADLSQQKRNVVVCCRGCGRTVEMGAAELIALGIPADMAALDARERMKCSACGGRMIETWPALAVPKGKRGDGRG